MTDGLDERFWELAHKRFAAEGVGLHELIEGKFRNLLRSGAARMQGGGVAEDNEQVEVAEKNLGRLVDAMIKEVRDRELQAVNRSVFDFAVGRYCPAWPFC